MNSILENIDTIRRNKGYSQEYIATQIGMKQAGFSLIMSGERELKYNTLLQIAKVLQVSVIDLITFPEKYVPSKGGATKRQPLSMECYVVRIRKKFCRVRKTVVCLF